MGPEARPPSTPPRPRPSAVPAEGAEFAAPRPRPGRSWRQGSRPRPRGPLRATPGGGEGKVSAVGRDPGARVRTDPALEKVTAARAPTRSGQGCLSRGGCPRSADSEKQPDHAAAWAGPTVTQPSQRGLFPPRICSYSLGRKITAFILGTASSSPLTLRIFFYHL